MSLRLRNRTRSSPRAAQPSRSIRPAWRTSRYGAPYGVNQMNMIETRLERIFLSLDEQTQVESRRLQTKTKTRFI